MKLLQFNNQALMMLVTENAIIKSPITSGSNKSITLDDNNGLADNDYLLVGEVGKAKSEIAQINASVTPGTAAQVASLVFPHNAGTPIYKIPYNQVKFYHADTIGGTKTLIDTLAIDADSEYTVLVDTDNSTGYLFFTLYNSETTDESDYSGGFNYVSTPYGSRIKIREFVTSPHNWNKPLDEDTFRSLCDFAESEIFALKRWRFREKVVSFNSVASQQAYTKTAAGATDLGQLVYATYDGDPVFPVSLRVHKRLNWNSTQEGTPRTVCEFENELLFTPIPSEIEEIELFYYRNSSGFANETTESEIKLPQAIAFRILQDLWATSDQRKSKYFESRYLQTIAAMKLDDVKQVSKFPALSDLKYDDPDSVFDQIEHPNRIS